MQMELKHEWVSKTGSGSTLAHMRHSKTVRWHFDRRAGEPWQWIRDLYNARFASVKCRRGRFGIKAGFGTCAQRVCVRTARAAQPCCNGRVDWNRSAPEENTNGRTR